jgi:hypothetical protein
MINSRKDELEQAAMDFHRMYPNRLEILRPLH